MAIGAFKKLIPGDYQVTPYKAHKTWEFTEASVDDRDINVFKGELNNITDLAARTGSDREILAVKDTIYREIRHLYYGGSPNRGNGLEPTFTGNGDRAGDPFHTFGSNSDKSFKQLQDKKITWILVPQLVYGENIKPTTVVLKDYSTGNVITLNDDKNGNLFDTADSDSLALLDQVTTEFLYDYDNLVGYWPVNGTLLDKSGDSNDGVFEGGSAAYTESAAYYKALTFNSSSKDEVKLGSGLGSWTSTTGGTGSYAFGNTDNFSLSVWVKKNQNPVSGDIFNIFGREGLYGINYNLRTNSIKAGIKSSNTFPPTANTMTTVADISSSFTHIALTYAPKSTTGLKLYVNGELTNTETSVGVGDFSNPVELITNGDFSTNSDWTIAGGGWTIDTTNNEADCSGGQSGIATLTQEDVLEQYRHYEIGFTMKNRTAGSVYLYAGEGVITGKTAYEDGTYSETFYTSNMSGDSISIKATPDFSGSITDFSVKEDVADGSLMLGGSGSLEGIPNYFDGWIDEARIYNRTLTAKEAKALYDFPDGIPYVGNVFYEHGNIVITAGEKYETIASGTQPSDGFDLTFKGTVTTYEHIVYAVVSENEFNFTMNDTIRKRDADGKIDENDALIDMATGSEFQPYITTIGFYNDHRQLVAVAKLPKPIRNDPGLTEAFTVVIDA